ncbi:AraC family transcriptional regulator [Alteromonas stellipolaris]|uniref:AraC family transcriptional regulator n=1 Tax=Alteromonas stellipolaris TaxID=233316 RepID=UPI001DBF78AC|nr:AraC family transcriptional regulator [Alteromonas stellipolaris]MBZ2160560.1 helix-turn-helix transcriptional regulator [Alteromonas stellipolaris]
MQPTNFISNGSQNAHGQRTFRDIVNIGPHCIERFIDSTNAPEIKALDIELAGCSNLSGTYQVGRVTPPNHTIFYSLTGSGKILTPSGEYALPASSVIILPAHQSFEVQIAHFDESSATPDAINSMQGKANAVLDEASEVQNKINGEKALQLERAPRPGQKPWDIIWLNLSDCPRWQHFFDVEHPVQHNIELSGLHHAMELLYLETNSQHRQAVIPIIQQYLQHIATPVKSTHQVRLSALFAAVEKQLQFNWDIDALVDKVHYSAPHLHRLCLAQFGRSPMQHVIYLRMLRAKNLLISTQWPIAYIANYVGYSNVFTFSKRFKKSQGMPPSEFRQRQSLN